ncbi:MAG: M20/M25/M40 family metallo-hydrolase [Candidatus Bipolaricaulis sp.]|nr:M20/M25/M40 family metallo-hydrolase [Candidatus Bipolaricaulis sp.]
MEKRRDIVALFCDLVRIDSESGEEAEFLRYLADTLGREFGATCEFDDAGNLIARVEASGSTADPVVLSAHADTVKPGRGIEPIVEDGVIRSAGPTILAADDKAGIAQIVEAIRTARRRPPVEIVVTVGEEVGLRGARQLDLGRIRSRRAFVIDGEHTNEIVIGGPTHVNFDITITGKAAHAGMEPEKGISAIRVAAAAILAMPEGRIDFETTANVGVIEGGLIRNGVPESVKIKAECRSLTHEKALAQARAMREAFENAARDAGATVEIAEEIEYEAMSVPEDGELVRAAKNAIRAAGLEPIAKRVTGGTDALVFANRGLDAVVLGYGGKKAHSKDEHIEVATLRQGAEVLRHLLESLA